MDEASRSEANDPWNPQWEISRNGNYYFRSRDISGTVMLVKGGGYKYVVNDRNGNPHWSPQRYSSQNKAMEEAIQIARKYLK